MSAPLGVTDQVRRAFQKQNRLASVIGCALGAFVPIATCTLAHHEADPRTLAGRVAIALVLGGLAYSATTVYGWARIAFQNVIKAIGFVVLLEGTMTLAHSVALAVAALVILTVINALATACNLATDQKEARKEAKAANVKPVSLFVAPPIPKSRPVKIAVRKAATAGKRARK